VNDDLKKGERPILVVAPNWLGDAVMALPAIADVRRAFPGQPVVVAARPSVAPVFSLSPSVDRVTTLQWRGKALDRRAFRSDVGQVRQTGADIALLLPNSFGAAWLVNRAGVSERWGYATDARRPLLSRAVRRPRRGLHQSAYYQHLTRALGMTNGPLDPGVVVPAEAIESARALLVQGGWDGVRPLVVLAPGAAYGTAKRWLPSHFGRLATAAVARRGAQCVLVGSEGDRDTARWVRREIDGGAVESVIDLTGATSLHMLAGVLRLAGVCVSNDSGAMHLAGAVGTPLVALFGPTREKETAPLTRPESRADVLTNPVWCRPCMLRECPIDHRCMSGLSPETVFAAVERLMPAAGRR
jgi:heptosyltransferase-2